MGTDRLVDIFAIMAHHDGPDVGVFSLCTVAAQFMELSGAVIALSVSNGELTRLCTSNPVANKLMDLELTTGEGPTIDAAKGDAIEEPDLRTCDNARWLAYVPEALASGARAVFGFPVRVGAAQFGALSLYRDQPGPLSPQQSSDGYLMASVIARALLVAQSGDSQSSFIDELQGKASLDFVVHQAAGMIAVQGSLSVKNALVALRAHAFATTTPLTTLAEQVVARKLTLRPPSSWSDESGKR